MKILTTWCHIGKIFEYIFLSTETLPFLFYFRGHKRLLLFKGSLIYTRNSKIIILLCMDYQVTVGIGKNESEKK